MTDQPYHPQQGGEIPSSECSPTDVSAAWIVAGMLPALSGAETVEVLAWSGVIALGVAIAHSHLFRWLAVGWIAATLVPGVPLMGVAAGGSMSGRWPAQLRAAALGAVLGLVTLPGVLREAGALLLVAACVVALARRAE